MGWHEIIDNLPETVEDWDTNIKAAGLHHKWPEQLKEMHDLWDKKILRVQRLLAVAQASSNSEVVDNHDGTFSTIDVTQDRLKKIARYQAKLKRGLAVKELCIQEERIRKALEADGQTFDTPPQYRKDGTRLDVSDMDALTLPSGLEREPIGTTYYIDSDSGNNGNAGTSTGAAWADFVQYTRTTTRSPGDIAIVRRGTTARYDTGDVDLLFDDDGTILDNIYLKADNNNAFGDDVDLSATATATLTFGSKTVTYASDISGVLAAGDWIYAVGDDSEVFAYEVASVSTVTATLYLPYKGAQAGSGRTTTNMGAAPLYGLSSHTSSQFTFDADNFWNLLGIKVVSNNTIAILEVDTVNSLITRDMVLEAGAGNAAGIDFGSSDITVAVQHNKLRTHNCLHGIEVQNGSHQFVVKDSLFDGNSKASSYGLEAFTGHLDQYFIDCEFKNHGGADLDFRAGSNVRFRNCLLSSTKKIDSSGSTKGFFYFEDWQQTPSDTRVHANMDSVDDIDSIIQSETTTVRSGGSNISIKVGPLTNFDEFKLLEIPIYADTSSKTYTVYVKSNATADWTVNPTAAELELHFEAWGHASNNHRNITKSTDVADFNGVTTWEALAVTVAPAQSGVGYLRLIYRKPKEASVSNEFYVDTLPVIS